MNDGPIEIVAELRRVWAVDLFVKTPLRELWTAAELAAAVAEIAGELRRQREQLRPVTEDVWIVTVHRVAEAPDDPASLFRRWELPLLATLERHGYIQRARLRGFAQNLLVRPGPPSLRLSALERVPGGVPARPAVEVA